MKTLVSAGAQRAAPQGLSQWLALGVCVGVCFAAAALAARLTSPEIGGWYAALNKPAWNPPNRVFGPVWSALYLLMGVAVWLVWRARGFSADAALPLLLFAAQLALNMLWSLLFFRMHRPGLAFGEIASLWVAIFATLLAFLRVSPLAAWLLVPYLLWVTFAAVLNYTIWKLNS